jgi:hypothetical protein
VLPFSGDGTNTASAALPAGRRRDPKFRATADQLITLLARLHNFDQDIERHFAEFFRFGADVG